MLPQEILRIFVTVQDADQRDRAMQHTNKKLNRIEGGKAGSFR